MSFSPWTTIHAQLLTQEGSWKPVTVDCVLTPEGTCKVITTKYIPGEGEAQCRIAFEAEPGDDDRYNLLKKQGYHFGDDGSQHWKVQVKAFHAPCTKERDAGFGNAEVPDINGPILFVACYRRLESNVLIYFNLRGEVATQFREELSKALDHVRMSWHLTRRTWSDFWAFAGGIINPHEFDDYASVFQETLAYALNANPHVPQAVLTAVRRGHFNLMHEHTPEEFLTFLKQAPGSMEEATQYVRFAFLLSRSRPNVTDEENELFWARIAQCMELVVSKIQEFDLAVGLARRFSKVVCIGLAFEIACNTTTAFMSQLVSAPPEGAPIEDCNEPAPPECATTEDWIQAGLHRKPRNRKKGKKKKPSKRNATNTTQAATMTVDYARQFVEIPLFLVHEQEKVRNTTQAADEEAEEAELDSLCSKLDVCNMPDSDEDDVLVVQDENIACPICFDDYSAEMPRMIMPCGHYICESCLNNVVAMTNALTTPCPMCRDEFAIDNCFHK